MTLADLHRKLRNKGISEEHYMKTYHKKCALRTGIMLSTMLLFTAASCTSVGSNKETSTESLLADSSKDVDTASADSIALLQLTKRMVQWAEEEQQGSDFVPVDLKSGDSSYRQLDMEKHKERLDELRATQLFSASFIDNYNQIAKQINQKMLENKLVWNEGELPPFGDGASPWCNCQDRPDDYQDQLRIRHVKADGASYAYQWNMGNDVNVATKAVKEGDKWKISWIDGFDYRKMVSTFQLQP